MMMITSEKAQTFPPNLRNVWTNKIPRGRVRFEGPASCVRQVRIRPFTRRLLPPHSTSTNQASLTASMSGCLLLTSCPAELREDPEPPCLYGFLRSRQTQDLGLTLLSPPPLFATVAAISSTLLTLRTPNSQVYRVTLGSGL